MCLDDQVHDHAPALLHEAVLPADSDALEVLRAHEQRLVRLSLSLSLSLSLVRLASTCFLATQFPILI